MTTLFLSCEHGGNELPADLRSLFSGERDVLDSHRGLDIGALDLFKHLVPLAAFSMHATISRLCIELNRSEHHPQLFSRFTKGLPTARKQQLLAFHRNYRNAFTDALRQRMANPEDVVHVAVHSFTPVLDGERRTMDIGLLYDPSRQAERAFCMAWRKALLARMPALTVRMNRPYKGTSDGFPTSLRRLFPKHYAGIELEVNQRFATNGRMDRELVQAIRASLESVLGSA
jgi:predicted N-formylglutamate amidohydrolase